MKFNFLLIGLLLLTLWSCGEKEVIEEEIIIEKEIDADIDPGLIHNVYFWLKEDITDEERKAFLHGVKQLGNVASVQRIFIGKPANTENRDVVDNSFDYSLQLWFEDQAGQNAYQIDPIHLKFVELQDLWTKVVVRDNLPL